MNPKSAEGATETPEALLQRLELHISKADAVTGEILSSCTAALRQEMAKWQRLLDAVDTVILGLDAEGRITLINRRASELLGYRDDELIGRSWFNTCLPETDEARVVSRIFRQIMSGQLVGVEYFENEVLTRAGERRIVAWRNNYLKADDGGIIGTLSAGEDITERRRAEAALRESEARLDHLLTSSPAVIFSCRPGEYYETSFVSDNIRDQMGYAPSRFLEEPEFWVKHLHPDDRTRVLDKLAGHLEQGTHCDEYRFRHADGSWRWIRDERKLLRDARGRVEEIVGSWSDVTERKNAEQQTTTLLHENRQLMQRLFAVQEAERRRLARELHDEFGQWLSAVQANARAISVLDASRLTEIHESARAVDECIGEVQAGIRRLIQDLRPAILDELGLQDGLHELVSQWQAHHPHIRCDFSVTGSLRDADEATAITVYRLVQEALTNVARHARARHALVELRRQRTDAGDTLLLHICDDGVGISANVKGKGLGLLGMRERVLAAGGTYNIETAPKQGVTLEITLPIGALPAKGLRA